jgi:hypothetical protein
MRNIIHFIVLFYLSISISCVSIKTYQVKPNAKISQLNVGMSKAELLNTMGTGDITTERGIIPQPYKMEITRDPLDGVPVEVIYYYTGIKQIGNQKIENELTPFFVKQNKLIGWGWRFFNDLKVEK